MTIVIGQNFVNVIVNIVCAIADIFKLNKILCSFVLVILVAR